MSNYYNHTYTCSDTYDHTKLMLGTFNHIVMITYLVTLLQSLTLTLRLTLTITLILWSLIMPHYCKHLLLHFQLQSHYHNHLLCHIITISTDTDMREYYTLQWNRTNNTDDHIFIFIFSYLFPLYIWATALLVNLCVVLCGSIFRQILEVLRKCESVKGARWRSWRLNCLLTQKHHLGPSQ